MPIGVQTVIDRSAYQTRGNPLIWGLANEAVELTRQAQATSNPQERFQLLQRALALRTDELGAWEMLGDKVGQSLACNGIGNVHLLTNTLDVRFSVLTNTTEHARASYARALAHLEGLHDEEAVNQRAIVHRNVLQLQLFASTRLLHKKVRVHGLENATHYNGRRGKVEGLISPCKYKVRLYAVVGSSAAPEVTISIHESNLVVVCESE
jgi:hypothetical protein